MEEKPYKDALDLMPELRDQENREMAYQFAYMHALKSLSISPTYFEIHSCKENSHCSPDGRFIYRIPKSNGVYSIECIMEAKKSTEFKDRDSCIKSCTLQASMYNWMDRNRDCNVIFVCTEKFMARVYITEEMRVKYWAAVSKAYNREGTKKIRPNNVWDDKELREVCKDLQYDVWDIQSLHLEDVVVETIEHFIN